MVRFKLYLTNKYLIEPIECFLTFTGWTIHYEICLSNCSFVLLVQLPCQHSYGEFSFENGSTSEIHSFECIFCASTTSKNKSSAKGAPHGGTRKIGGNPNQSLSPSFSLSWIDILHCIKIFHQSTD